MMQSREWFTHALLAGFCTTTGLALPGCAGVADSNEASGLTVTAQAVTHGHEVPSPTPYPGLVNIAWAADGHKAGCGGVLISPTRVLTANHCVHITEGGVTVSPVPANFRVYANRYHFDFANPGAVDEGQVHSVSQIIERPDYVEPYGNDLAILVLATPARALPATLLSAQGVAVGTDVDMVGWGKTESGSTTTPHAATVQLRGIGSGCNGLETKLQMDGRPFWEAARSPVSFVWARLRHRRQPGREIAGALLSSGKMGSGKSWACPATAALAS